MLLLERKLEQGVRIGPGITVKLLRVGANRVLLGVDAPPDVPVWRDEIAPPCLPPKTESIRDARLRVLVVENEPTRALLITRALLQETNTIIMIASNADDAIRSVGMSQRGIMPKPDLVLLDMVLPDRSWLDVLDHIRYSEVSRLTPVVVLGSSADAVSLSRCMSAGANAFVPNTLEDDAFLHSIHGIAKYWRAAKGAA